MFVTKRDGSKEPFNHSKIDKLNQYATSGLAVRIADLEHETKLLMFDGIKTSDIFDAQIRAAASLISVEQPDYTYVAARLLLSRVLKEISGSHRYLSLREYVEDAVEQKLLNPALLDFDLDYLDKKIDIDRDFKLEYLGLQTLADRYFIREFMMGEDGESEGKLLEAPQHFFMRVAMGLALEESDDRDLRAVEFYNVLSNLEFMSSTPTLFNAGTMHSQLSSCYVNVVADNLSAEDGENRYASIYGTIEECGRLSKFAGGIGTSWTPVRAAGDLIKSTRGKSSGIVPYLKVYNDTAVAVNQGGKRKGSFAPYLEPWHPDLFAFLDLKKNTGDDRMRAHDIYPANWIPDLFMQRVMADGVWSFFSPKDFPELHDLFGDAFAKRYEELEAAGKFVFQKPAKEVWRKMLTALFETGHPWITFKDEMNRRNPQQHVGVIHSSNLCTEIALNTSDDETAVCNLGSINLAAHLRADGSLDTEKMQRTIRTAMRMLDNVIDINFYPSSRAKASNLKHRPVGFGVMGYTEAMVATGIDWESETHLDWADKLMEFISYHVIDSSADLARERGSYESFPGSLWSQGILPIDTARDQRSLAGMDWDALRQKVKGGMRNSNTMAIAPTATIGNIVGTTVSIEPVYKRVYVKSNLSGEFKVVDRTLRYGRPELCKESFDIDQSWVIRAAARRQKWIDQSQSLNIFAREGVKGRDLDYLYKLAWQMGVKTTYYLRTLSNKKKDAPLEPVEQKLAGPSVMDAPVNLCSLDNPDCESCQ